MCAADVYLKGLVILAQRTQDFLNDGYSIVFQHKDTTLCLVKLIHTNGNRITLKYDVIDGRISQCTNGRETHSEEVR